MWCNSVFSVLHVLVSLMFRHIIVSPKTFALCLARKHQNAAKDSCVLWVSGFSTYTLFHSTSFVFSVLLQLFFFNLHLTSQGHRQLTHLISDLITNRSTLSNIWIRRNKMQNICLFSSYHTHLQRILISHPLFSVCLNTGDFIALVYIFHLNRLLGLFIYLSPSLLTIPFWSILSLTIHISVCPSSSRLSVSATSAQLCSLSTSLSAFFHLRLCHIEFSALSVSFLFLFISPLSSFFHLLHFPPIPPSLPLLPPPSSYLSLSLCSPLSPPG